VLDKRTYSEIEFETSKFRMSISQILTVEDKKASNLKILNFIRTKFWLQAKASEIIPWAPR
jgi:hypothetical protein